MAQFARPISDISQGSWTDEGIADNDGNLWSSVDESAHDGDNSYIVSGAIDSCTLQLGSLTDPGVDTGFTLHAYFRSIGSGGPERVNFRLFEGSTLISASSDYNNRDSVYADAAWAIAEADIANISDFTNLRVSATVTNIAGGEEVRITQIYLQIPDVPTLLSQPHFRIRTGDDQLLNANAGWAAALDTNASIPIGMRFRIRFEIEGGNLGSTVKLQFRKGTGTWYDVGIQHTSNQGVQCMHSQLYSDGDVTSNVLAGSSQPFTAGEGDEDNGVSGQNLTGTILLVDQHTEVEFCIMIHRFYSITDAGDYNRNDANDTYEFRVVQSDGTLFPGIYNNPTITLTLPSYYIGGTAVESPNRTGPIKDGNGNLYKLMETTDTDPEPIMMKSADGGLTWIDQDSANRPPDGTFDNELEAADMVLEGDTLWILVQGNNDVNFYQFHVSTHAITPDQWGTQQLVTSISNRDDQCVAIEARSDGTAVGFYTYIPGSFDQVRYKIRSAGGTWGSEQNLDAEASTHFDWVSVVKGANDKIHIFYTDNTNGTLYHRSLDGSNNLSAREVVSSDIQVGLGGHHGKACAPPVYWDDGGSEKIMVVFMEDTNEDLWSMMVVDDGSPTNRQQVTSTTVYSNAGSGHQPQMNLAIDPGDGTAYCHFVDDATLDVWRDSNANGAGWGIDTEEINNIDGGIIRGSIFTHSSGNGGATVVGYVLAEPPDSNSEGGTGFLWYHEYVIAAGGSFVNFSASALAQSSTPSTVAINIVREMAANLLAGSTTPDTVTLDLGGVIVEFSAGAQAISSTPATVSLAVLREMLAAALTASGTPDTVVLAVAGTVEFAAVALAVSATPDIVVANVLRAMQSVGLAASITPDGVTLDVAAVISFTAVSLTQSATPDNVTVSILRAMLATATVTSGTSDVAAINILRETLSAALAGSATTDVVDLNVLKAMSAASLAASVTPDNVTLDVAAIVVFAAAVLAASNVPDNVRIDVLRTVIAACLASSVTPDSVDLAIAGMVTFIAAALAQSTSPENVMLAVVRELAVSALATSATPDDVVLVSYLLFIAASLAIGNTSDISRVNVLREITSVAQAGSVTSIPVLPILRKLNALVEVQSITPDDARLAITLIAGLVSIQFVGKQPQSTFQYKQSGVSFVGKSPSIMFEE
jgi:hypothetical protein